MNKITHKYSLQEAIDRAVAHLDSIEIAQFINQLPSDPKEALDKFCKRFDLDKWFIEALNGKNIVDELKIIVAQRQDEELEANEEYEEIQSDLRIDNGWSY